MSGIIRYDPFRNVFSWPKWMDDFDESVQKGLKIHETNKAIIAEAVIAGVSSEDVEVVIEDGILTIKAESSTEKKEKDGVRSSSYQYYYTCALTGGKWNKAEADIKDGIVKVTIPKIETTSPKKITVKAKGK